MTKLILGTASFGSNYGIKQDGQPDEKEIERIARVAWDGGIQIIHTCFDYFTWNNSDNEEEEPYCKIIGLFYKFSKIKKDCNNPILFHLDTRTIESCMSSFCHNYGISIYDMIEYLEWKDKYQLKAVQVPLNVLDNRFLNHTPYLKSEGVKIHARSVFLQGLLLMEDLPAWVNGQARAHIKLFHHICKKEGYEPYEAALGWVLGLDEIDKVIVGVNSARQLQQLLKVSPLKWDYDFSITDEMVLDPRKWPKA